VQFRFDEPVAVRRNDRFIIRFYSPTITFGGGIVLEAEALKHKRNHEEVIDSLHIKELGTDLEVLELELKEESRFLRYWPPSSTGPIRKQRNSWRSWSRGRRLSASATEALSTRITGMKSRSTAPNS